MGVRIDRVAPASLESPFMLSEEKLEAYRRMTPEERWREVEELRTLAWRDLCALPPEERERRLAIIRQEHEESDAIKLEHLRRYF